MFLSPPEIQRQELKTRGRGYDREQVDRLLEDVVSSFDQVWRERDELREQIEAAEREIARYREMERLLSDSLVTGQKAAERLQEHAERDAELVLAQAREQAEKIGADARRERDRLQLEIQRLEIAETELQKGYRAFLLEALEVLEHKQEREAEEAPLGQLPQAMRQQTGPEQGDTRAD